VIDTHVLIAGILWRGPPHALLEHVRAGTVGLISSPALLAELADVIGSIGQSQFPFPCGRHVPGCASMSPSQRLVAWLPHPLFGMWRDRDDIADVAGHVRSIRASRFNDDGTRRKG
jgi:predicted nucleic acid-binding protein